MASNKLKQRTYGQEIDAISCEVSRLGEIVTRTGRRAGELEHGRALLCAVVEQMRAQGKRRSSGYYGLHKEAAA